MVSTSTFNAFKDKCQSSFTWMQERIQSTERLCIKEDDHLLRRSKWLEEQIKMIHEHLNVEIVDEPARTYLKVKPKPKSK